MKNIFVAITLISLASCGGKQQADLIVHNAVVYTVDSTFSTATTFAVKDGKFLSIGDSAAIFGQYQSDSVVDAHHKSIFPGLYDAHAHFYGLGQMLDQADLTGTTSTDEIIERLKKYQTDTPKKYGS